jgi:hypothetical protein
MEKIRYKKRIKKQIIKIKKKKLIRAQYELFLSSSFERSLRKCNREPTRIFAYSSNTRLAVFFCKALEKKIKRIKKEIIENKKLKKT